MLEGEQELLQKIKNDPNYFGVLFDRYYPAIFGYVLRRVMDYDLARDVAAETFLKAFLKVQSFHWRGISISSWLYRIATNEVNQTFRKKRYRPEKLGSIIAGNFLLIDDASREEMEEELSRHEEFMRVQQKLKTLETRYQEVIALRYFERKDNKEIAEILGKPEGTVKSLLSRGIEKLKVLCNQ